MTNELSLEVTLSISSRSIGAGRARGAQRQGFVARQFEHECGRSRTDTRAGSPLRRRFVARQGFQSPAFSATSGVLVTGRRSVPSGRIT